MTHTRAHTHTQSWHHTGTHFILSFLHCWDGLEEIIAATAAILSKKKKKGRLLGRDSHSCCSQSLRDAAALIMESTVHIVFSCCCSCCWCFFFNCYCRLQKLRLPRLIQNSLFHRQQVNFLCATAWNGAAEPRRSAELHTPHSQFLLHEVLELCRLRSPAGEAPGEARVPATPHPTSLSSQPQVSLVHHERRELIIPAPKHLGCFLAITLPPRINFSFVSLEAQHCFHLFGICGDKTSFILILHAGTFRTNLQTCLWHQEAANQLPNFSNQR